MDLYYSISAFLLFFIGFAHSYLGERYILIRLFKRKNLPKLFGGVEFTKLTLRFAWHLTTVAWFGFATILMILANGQFKLELIVQVIAVTFLLHGVIALLFSRGKHLAWIVFIAVALMLFYVVNH